MSVFDDAVAALHSDPNLSTACTWSAGPARAPAGPVAFRGIESRPEMQEFGGATLGTVTPRREVNVPRAALPVDPERGDRITIGAEAFKVETAELDIEGVTWRLTLSETE
ncbi:hypothetical protein GXW78_07585 [Roseomonas terrae]|uniref:Head-tail adaptor protein n=1 Tax=Neoroseomonas terrae TaxID=424799 RepID=A0ABS5EES0_9PROT|nr:hypothetical protein [Neoroseomonas terrae]MBR0649516.1 hypothetical protein [Neoroseomonas terrae]